MAPGQDDLLAVVRAAEALGATPDVPVKITVRTLMRELGDVSLGTAASRLKHAIEMGFLEQVASVEGYGQTTARLYRLGKATGETVQLEPTPEIVQSTEIVQPDPAPVVQSTPSQTVQTNAAAEIVQAELEDVVQFELDRETVQPPTIDETVQLPPAQELDVLAVARRLWDDLPHSESGERCAHCGGKEGSLIPTVCIAGECVWVHQTCFQPFWTMASLRAGAPQHTPEPPEKSAAQSISNAQSDYETAGPILTRAQSLGYTIELDGSGTRLIIRRPASPQPEIEQELHAEKSILLAALLYERSVVERWRGR
jgi:hypothetical protein